MKLNLTSTYTNNPNMIDCSLSRKTCFNPTVHWSMGMPTSGFKELYIQEGLTLILVNLQINQPIEICFHVRNPALEFTFYNRSRNDYSLINNKGESIDLQSSSGMNTISYFPGTRASTRLNSGQDIEALSVQMDPLFLKRNIGCQFSLLPLKLRQVISNPNQGHFYSNSIMLPSVEMVVQQIQNCLMEGELKNAYLEAKILELIILRLSQLFNGERALNKPKSLNREDESRIRDCEQLLINNLRAPPSLAELAEYARMSHTKLNRGFKTIFGQTAFKHLMNIRVKKGKNLLEDGVMNITEVAYETGFSSPSHFARTFIEKYGIQPSTYLKNRLGIQPSSAFIPGYQKSN